MKKDDFDEFFSAMVQMLKEAAEEDNEESKDEKKETEVDGSFSSVWSVYTSSENAEQHIVCVSRQKWICEGSLMGVCAKEDSIGRLMPYWYDIDKGEETKYPYNVCSEDMFANDWILIN